MENWVWWLIQLTLVVGFLVYLLNKKFRYWSDRGIDGPRGVPFLGNMWEQMVKGQLTCELEWMRRFGKVYGTYNGFKPTLTILDHELIKQVMVKDFNVFVNRRKNRSDHEIWGRNLFGAENEDWKRIRTITSPSFTSGKLRAMTDLMNRCVDRLVHFLDKRCADVTKCGLINTKEVIAGFSIDVIACTSFGTETNANTDEGDREQSPFVHNGLRLLLTRPIRVLILTFVPASVRRLFGFTLNLDPQCFQFFVELSKQVLQTRRADASVKRNDLVQLLMDAKTVADTEWKDVHSYAHLTANTDEDDQSSMQSTPASVSDTPALSDNEIIAQCILFFAAGFETTSSTLSHALYELATNPDVQHRLANELHRLDGMERTDEAYFDAVMNSQVYLDAVIKETLRKYPPVPRLTRRVMVDGYRLGPVTLTVDQGVEIPTYAVHHCALYYADPDRFDPDRFLPENKANLVPYTYLPFVQGPRNCVGMRFAYQEMKLCLAAIVRRYRFSVTPETPAKLEFTKLGLMSVKNFPLKVSLR